MKLNLLLLLWLLLLLILLFLLLSLIAILIQLNSRSRSGGCPGPIALGVNDQIVPELILALLEINFVIF